MATSSDKLPLDRVAIGYCDFKRKSPATLSGHGFRRCQTRLSSAASVSESVMPRCARMLSRMRRCSASMCIHGSVPLRTSCIAGW